MSNFFDQFDDQDAPKAKSAGNFFDQFDEPQQSQSEVSPERTVGGTIKDVGVSAAKSVVGLGEAAVGLANIATGGLVGKGLDTIGYDPEETNRWLDEYYSEAQKAANKKVQDAEGFIGTGKAMLQNPSTIGHGLIETMGVTGGGGAIGRGAYMAMGKLFPALMKNSPKLAAAVAGGIGEGLITTGSQSESIRQQDPNRELTARNVIASVGTGIGTGVIGAVGGKLAQKFGLTDVDTFLAGGSFSDAVKKGGVKEITRRILGGGIAEGVFEEMPQSAQEQMWLNAATGRPLMDGVSEAAAQGAIIGFGMGGGVNIFDSGGPSEEDQMINALASGEIDTQERTAAANQVYNRIYTEDKNLARAWVGFANEAIKGKAPMDLGEFTRRYEAGEFSQEERKGPISRALDQSIGKGAQVIGQDPPMQDEWETQEKESRNYNKLRNTSQAMEDIGYEPELPPAIQEKFDNDRAAQNNVTTEQQPLTEQELSDQEWEAQSQAALSRNKLRNVSPGSSEDIGYDPELPQNRQQLDHGYRVVGSPRQGFSVEQQVKGEWKPTGIDVSQAQTKEEANSLLQDRINVAYSTEHGQQRKQPDYETVNIETIKTAFPGTKVEYADIRSEDGATFKVTTAGGSTVYINSARNEIRIENPEQAAADHAGVTDTGGKQMKAYGSFQLTGKNGLIQLVESSGESETMDHELYHAAERLVLKDKEIKVLAERFGTEEGRAVAYQQYRTARIGEQRDPFTPRVRKIFAKLYDFGMRIRHMVSPTAESTQREIESGRVWNRSERDGKMKDPAFAQGGRGDEPRYSIRTKPAPKKTQKSYKLFREKDGKGYPLFIDRSAPVEPGVWYDADSPQVQNLASLAPGKTYLIKADGTAVAQDFQNKMQSPTVKMIDEAGKNGERYIYVGTFKKTGEKSFHNWGVNGSGSVATFAMRPGWHSTNIPAVRHIGKRKKGSKTPDYRRADERWAEIEVAADQDYQQEAAARASKDIPEKIPEDGYYSFRTNSNAEQAQDWLISGSIKINRFLTDEEAAQIAESNGFLPDLPREPTAVNYSANKGAKRIKRVTKDTINSPEFKKWLGDSKVRRAVYHGSPTLGRDGRYIFQDTDTTKTKSPLAGLGHFFAEDRNEAAGYAGPGGKNFKVALRIENPLEINSWDIPRFNDRAEAKAFQKRMKLRGHDGVHLVDENHWVAFDANQIKSLEANTGEFSLENDDIRYSAGEGGNRSAKRKPASSLQQVRDSWDALGIDHYASERDGIITVSKIVIPDRNRQQGLGTRAMRELFSYADATGQIVALSPSTDFGGSSVSRLKQFYKKMGFIANKGRNKDYQISESMYRPYASGKKHSISEGGFRAVDQQSPKFRKWFNDSVVVDSDGDPLTVFHGTGSTKEFTEFRSAMTGQGNDQIGSGFYFTTDPDEASAYTGNRIASNVEKLGGEDSPGVIPAHLSIQNPILVEGSNLNDTDIDLTTEQAAAIIAYSPALSDPEDSPLGNWFDSWDDNGFVFEEWMVDEVAENYDGPSLISIEGDFFSNEPEHSATFRKALHEVLGYDGVVQEFEGGKKHFVAWFPEQVKSAVSNTGEFSKSNPDIRYSASAGAKRGKPIMLPFRGEQDLTKVERDTESIAPKYSIRTWTDAEKKRVAKTAADMKIGPKRLNKWLQDIDNVMAIVLNNPGLDYESTAMDIYTALKANSDPHYTRSLDFSTLCRKRYVLAATIEKIQKQLGRAVEKEDWVKIRNMLNDKGVTVSCGACYVDSKRMEEGKFINQFIEANPQYPAEWFLTQSGVDALKRNDPELYKEFRKKAGANNNKASESRVDYRGEIREYFIDSRAGKKRVDEFNERSGLRWQSWSDFEVPHLMDAMQAVLDMHMAGLKGHAYTKVPEFVEAMGDTGLMINMSLIPEGNGFDADGNLAFSPVEGMPFEKAIRLRERFPKTAGTIAISVSNDHTRALLEDPRIDYVIPYHASGLAKDIAASFGIGMDTWEDFTKTQTPAIGDPVKFHRVVGKQDASLQKLYAEQMKRKPDQRNWSEYAKKAKSKGLIDPDFTEYWSDRRTGQANAKKYLELCKKRGVLPKFRAHHFSDRSLDDFTQHPGYWKLLIDRKSFDNDGKNIKQRPVQPSYPDGAVEKILADYKPIPSKADQQVVQEFIEDFRSAPEKQSLSVDKGAARAPIWHSRLINTISAKGPKTASAQQWLQTLEQWKKKGTLPAPVQEELEWSGLEDWLKDAGPKAKISRDDVLVMARGVEVQEVVKGGSVAGSTKYESYQLPGGENYKELLITLPNSTPSEPFVVTDQDGEVVSFHQTEEEARNRAFEVGGYWDETTDEEVIGKINSGKTYQSSHWDEPNVLAHIRFNERTDAEGNKVLFIEEVQSDWHQEGRKKGYRGETDNAEPTAIERGEITGGVLRPDRQRQEVTVIFSDGFRYETSVPAGWTDEQVMQRAADGRQELSEISDRVEGTVSGVGVPNAPFKTSWPMLAMKRMIRYAAENGFDKIAWTTGEQQADRYDLSKQVKEIQYEQDTDGSDNYDLIALGFQDEDIINEEDISLSRIEQLVGKEIAEKIQRGEGEDRSSSFRSWKSISGPGLKVGGEGMKSFYNKMLPSAVAKFIKKFGAKVGVQALPVDQWSLEVSGETIARDHGIPENQIDSWWAEQVEQGNTGKLTSEYREKHGATQQLGFDITPEMRSSALGEGMPLFSVAKGQVRSPVQYSEELAELRDKVSARIKKVSATKTYVPVDAGEQILNKLKTQAGNLSKAKVARKMQGYEQLIAKMADDKADLAAKIKALEIFLVKEAPKEVRGHAHLQGIYPQLAKVNTERARLKLLDRAITRLDQLNDIYLRNESMRDMVKAIRKARPKLKGQIEKQTAGGYSLFHELTEIRRILGLSATEAAHEINDLHEALDRGELFGDQEQVELDELIAKRVDGTISNGEDARLRAIIANGNEAKLRRMSLYANLSQRPGGEAYFALTSLKGMIAQKTMDWIDEMVAVREQRQAQRIEAGDEISGGKGLMSEEQEKLQEREAQKPLKAFLNQVRSYDDKHQSWEWLLDKLSRYSRKGVLNSGLVSRFGTMVNRATNNEQAGLTDQFAEIQAKMAQIWGVDPKKLDKVRSKDAEIIETTGVYKYNEKGDKLSQTQIPLSQNMAYKRWMEWQDPTLRENLQEQGYTAETLSEIESFMTPEIRAWAEWQLREFYPKYHPGINSVFRELFYTDMPFNPNYSPIRRQYNRGDVDDNLLKQNNPWSSVVAGSIKQRVDNHRPIMLQDGDAVLASHISQMEHFKAWAAPMRELRAVLGSEHIRTLIKQYHGDSALTVLNNFMDDFARGKVHDRFRSEWVRYFRSRFTTAAVGANPVVFIKQLTSIPAYAMDIPAKEWVKRLGQMNTPGKVRRAYRTLMKSDMMKARYEIGFERDMILAMGSMQKTTGTKSLADKLMILTKLGDRFAIVYGGWPVYTYNYDQAKGQGKSDAEAHAIALEKFEESTMRSQQAGQLKDLNQYQRGGAFAQLFTMFYTSPASYYRNWIGGIRGLQGLSKDEWHKLLTGQGKPEQYGAAKRVFITQVVLPSLFMLAANGFEWDDDDMLKAVITGPMSGMFLLRDLSLGAYNHLTGDINYADPGLPPMFSTMGEAGKAIGKARKHAANFTEMSLAEWLTDPEFWETLQSAGTVAGNVAGIPFGPASRTGEGVVASTQGKTVAPVRRAIGYSENKIDSIGREYKDIVKQINAKGKTAKGYALAQQYQKQVRLFNRQIRDAKGLSRVDYRNLYQARAELMNNFLTIYKDM